MNTFFQKIIFKPNLLKEIGKKSISTSQKVSTLWEPDEKSGYKKPFPSFKERMREGLSELKSEIKLWSQEVKDTWEGDPFLVCRPGEVDIAWRFLDENSLKHWTVSSDSDHNEGFSNCSLTQTNYGKGVFNGNLSLRIPKDGKIKRAGYCNIKTMRQRKSFKRDAYLDWTPYNQLVMKIRGDGRSYLLNISTRGYFDISWNDVYHYVLFTRGGPYWQIAKIPFSKFFFSSKGRIQDRQEQIPLDKIASFGITAADRYGGDFSLEIDYIGLEYDPRHTEEFAYEMYQTDHSIIAGG